MDLRSGKVVFVGDGRGADSLKPFRERLKRSRSRIRALATDMSAAYIGSVLEHLPSVAVVLDHFHVVTLMNERRENARRKLTSNCHDRLGHASGLEVGFFQAAVREMGRGVLITSQNCLALPFAVKVLEDGI